MADEFVEETCAACGTRYTQRVGATCDHQCVPTTTEKPPRAIPTSIFNDPGSIGDRMREILSEEATS